MTPEEIRKKGYTILTNPDQIKDFNIVGQYGTTGAKGSFLYGTPKAGGSLKGTMTEDRSGTIVNEAVTPTENREIPSSVSSFANLRTMLAKSTRLAAAQGPSAEDYLNMYASKGVNLDPSAMASALQEGRISRAGMVQDVYKGALDLINEQEKRQTEYVNTVMSGLPKSFLAQMSGKEYDEIKSGNVSPELKQRIQEAEALDKQSGKVPSLTEQIAAQQAGWTQDESGEWNPPSQAPSLQPNIQFTEFNDWIKKTGTVTQDYTTPVSYFTDGRKTHNAIDIAGALNSPVYSPISGIVVESSSNSGWGNSIVIQDAEGNNWRLAHFNTKNVQNGQNVVAGQQLGQLGNTGFVLKGDGTAPTEEELKAGKGTHLHIEVKDKSGQFINPTQITQPKQTATTSEDAYWQALSIIPTQMKNSDAEKELIKKRVTQLWNQGITDPYQIADTFMGYRITNPDEFSTSIRNQFGKTDLDSTQIANVAKLINSGKKTEALTIVENALMNAAKKGDPDSYIGEATVRTAISRANSLQTTIDKLGDKSPIGVVSGTMETWLGKLKGKEAQKIATQVKNMTAEIRNGLSGTAVTPSEERFLEDLFPQLGNSPDNFITKLNNLKTQPLLELNSLRLMMNIPELDEETLKDKKKRVGLYESGVEQTGQEESQKPTLPTGMKGGQTSSGLKYTIEQ